MTDVSESEHGAEETQSPVAPTQPSTPNCDKLNAASDERDTVIDFIEWLGQNGYRIGEWNHDWTEDRLMPVAKSPDDLVLAYLDATPNCARVARRCRLTGANVPLGWDR